MKPVLLLSLWILASIAEGSPDVITSRAPAGGIQPVAETDAAGNVDVVFFEGDPAHGDLYHAVKSKGAHSINSPVRVSSTSGSAIAIGTIRGAQLALGHTGPVNVVWNGSSKVTPEKDHLQTPMLYARSTDGGKTFEAERNLITKAEGLDGGGAVAASGSGEVQVFWHAGTPGAGGGSRKVWVARSADDGKTFAAEVEVWDKDTGVCGCCGMTAGATDNGTFVLYRSATESVHRDIYPLESGKPFSGEASGRWKIETCPMSTIA